MMQDILMAGELKLINEKMKPLGNKHPIFYAEKKSC